MTEGAWEYQIRDLRRQGDYRGVARLLEALPAEDDVSWRVALTAARAEMGAGRIRSARTWLDASRVKTKSPEELALLDLEQAQCALYEDLDLQTGLAAAQRAEDLFGTTLAHDAGRIEAEARWAIVRLRLMASEFGELPPTARDELLAELPALEERFAALGLPDTSHFVALLRLERASGHDALHAWDAAAERALADGLPSIGGEALLGKAAVLLRRSAPDAQVLEVVAQAADKFASIEHHHGGIDCDRKREELKIQRRGAGLDGLAGCVDRYLEAAYPKGALSALLDLSTHAHARSDREAALASRQAIDRLSEEHGFGMTKKMAVFAAADLALRERRDALARDLCDEALALGLPRNHEAGLMAMRAASLSFAGRYDDAVTWRRRAIRLYEELGRQDDASEQIPSLASDLAQGRALSALTRADALLVEWIDRDRSRGALLAELAKATQRAELRVLQVLGKRNRGEVDPSAEEELLIEADGFVEETYSRIPADAEGRDWGLLIGRVGQTEAQIAAARGDEAGIEAAQTRSLQHFEERGLDFEAANSRYLLGCLRLNRANAAQGQDVAAHAEAAHGYLTQALEFYETVAGMRHMAAQTRHKLAMLCLNVQSRVTPEAATELRSMAERWLDEAAEIFDTLRRAYSSGDRMEAFSGKASLTADASGVAAEALRLHLAIASNPQKAWAWTVRSKAEALDDLLGAEARVPSSLEALLEQSPEQAELVSKERSLADRLATAPKAERLALDQELTSLRAEMRTHPTLQEYVDLRTGDAAGPEDLSTVALQAPTRFSLVDWVFVGRSIWLLVARAGESPIFERLPLDRERVRAFVENDLSARDFRFTLKDDPGALRALDPLVEPLALYTSPDEHLILCPTGALHGIPLHALHTNGGPLLARNPVSYTPSLGVLRLCIQRDERTLRDVQPVVFGDPTEDRPEAEAVARKIADAMGVTPILGAEVTRTRFERALSEASLIHYQGHALHDRATPLSSRLELAGGERFEARRLFSLRRIETRMATLGACESAASVVREGDEQLGLIPALLIAGVRTVVAAGWRIAEASAANFMEAYYAKLAAGESPVLAARAAALDVRSRSGWSAPYHWAAYTVHGDPWRTYISEETLDG